MTILVTGATGKVGGAALRLLRASGAPVRALVRTPSDLPEAVRGDLAEPASLGAALTGVDAVFLVYPTLQADHAAPELIAALAEHGRHIVYVSARGADPAKDAILGSHGKLEQFIADSGAPWTFLRPSGFAGNTLGWASQIRAGDEVRWFHGGAKRALIHERDIAAVGVAAITGGHHGVAYDLSGPEQLTQVEQVTTIGDVLGRSLRFVELDPDTAKRELFPDMPGIVDGHAAMVANPEPVADTVERVLGRKALTYRQWVEDHIADFS
ncbi:SDR family oxidoreductase [Labedaea rhizosphaerae]|uniref:Uncharacterized protein YbjT (DUF2867 family) n=1 Tax=Labedaea rhizosphaerae TaxID=598644 RepID=A0A4R6RY49_LABRH|nr:NAD(P)H-binding protein [Labedaea rhizosphaerae]TDP92020.1 uncharacterized protein YbjT (DUF2867 family) [Labedaea rhizosphaerae]